MDAFGIIIALCIFCAFWNVAVTLIIYDNLRKRGNPVGFLWLRLMAPAYAFRYKKITRSETGKTGPLFYHWILSINLALVLAVMAIVLAL
jgi:hypothetical protein